MSKTKKKRNKRYQGANAKQSSPPQVIRVAAVKRSNLGQWWHEKKKVVLRVGGIAGVIIVILIIIVEVIRLIFS